MKTILQQLARLTPWRLLLTSWVVLVALGFLTLVPVLEGFATAASFGLFVGYPYALILGLPEGAVRDGIRQASLWLFAGFVAVLFAMVTFIPYLPDDYSTPTSPASAREWLELAFGLVACVVVFAPFFLGAAALNDSRRYLQQDSSLESVPNFLALYFWFFGGLLHVHRRVREVLRAG